MLCDYGCGQNSIYKFKNGKSCCSDDFRKCPEVILKRINGCKDRRKFVEFENFEGFLCSYGCGCTAKFKSISKRSNKFCCSDHSSKCSKRVEKFIITNKQNWKNSEYREKTTKAIRDSRDKNFSLNQSVRKIKEWNNKNSNLYKRKLTLERIKVEYPTFYKVEDLKENKDGLIEVRCKLNSCRKWFVPNQNQFYHRLEAIEKDSGTEGCFFYCCKEHAKECPEFNIKTKRFDLNNPYSKTPKWMEDFIYNENDYCCQLCLETKDLQIHHEFPQSLYHELKYHINNMFIVCKKCHLTKIHRGECSSNALHNKKENLKNEVQFSIASK